MEESQNELWPGNRVEAEPARVINADDERYSRFVEGYFLFHGNQTKAAVYAGYAKAGAYSQGSRLMRRSEIAERIQARAHELKQDYSADRTLEELSYIAYVDPRRVVHEDGTPMRLNELDEQTARALESFECDDQGRLTKVKFTKMGGVDRMMRYHGLLKDKTEHTVKFSLEDLVTGAAHE